MFKNPRKITVVYYKSLYYDNNSATNFKVKYVFFSTGKSRFSSLGFDTHFFYSGTFCFFHREISVLLKLARSDVPYRMFLQRCLSKSCENLSF